MTVNGDPELTVIGSKLVFRMKDASNGFELWSSDGTAGGTALLEDLWPGTDSSIPAWFSPLGGDLLFRANPGAGQATHKTDGTTTTFVNGSPTGGLTRVTSNGAVVSLFEGS